jgi:hypothetical protein
MTMTRSIITLVALGLLAALGSKAAAQNAVTIRENGTVLAISPGNITASAGGKTYALKFKPEQSVVFVQGKLKPEQLQQGMIVRVTGTLKGTAIDGDVSEVKIYTSADGYQPGVLQDAPDQPATITGQLASAKNGVLTINAGRKRVTAKLAEGAKIILDTKDYSIVKGGEPIYIDGRTTDGKNVTARKIVITIGQPLEEPKPTGKAKKAK